MNKTIALYQSASTGAYGKVDITDVCNTMASEIGTNEMSAGIVTSIITLTDPDRQAFYYGAESDCIDYLMGLLDDHGDIDNQVEELREDYSKLVSVYNTLVVKNVGLTEDNYQLEKRVENLQSYNKRLIDAQDEKETAEQERQLKLTTEEKQAARQWLLDFGWIEENTGGGCMVMYKNFMCTDGKVRMVGIDGESEDGCLYSVSQCTYWALEGDYDGTDNDGTDENELLCQFQRDEIEVANSRYSDCY